MAPLLFGGAAESFWKMNRCLQCFRACSRVLLGGSQIFKKLADQLCTHTLLQQREHLYRAMNRPREGGDGVTHARIGSKQGDIFFKSSGAYQNDGDGNIVDLQYITGGSGDLANISGVIRASGTFNPATGMGESEYEGTVCLP